MIKTAFIGVGYRGKQLLKLLQHLPAFRVVAFADPGVENSDMPGVFCYNRGEDDYLNMLEEHTPDLVFVASPWQCHVQHALQCVARGCHVALEIKGGLYLEEYQPLIQVAEQQGCHVYPLENTLFMRENLSLYNLIKAGVMGDIVYMRGGYRHDLRHLLLDDVGHIGNRRKTESVWRSKFYQEENGDLYPTHGLAPLCMMTGINRKDRIKYLTSSASKPAGMLQRIKDLGGNTDVEIKMGDVVVTQLETENGVLISLTHDTTLPRPRSLDFEIQGTKGIWQGDRRMIYIEGVSPDETWEPDEAYVERYEHPYWQKWGEEALQIDTHHKGMDYIMLKAVEADLKDEIPYPATIQDLALWTSVTPFVEDIDSRTKNYQRNRMKDFAAIDFETANEQRTSVCSVGVVIVRDGEIVDRYYSLIRPEPEYYTYWNTRVHGLTLADTENAPLFPTVWQEIASRIEGLPLVAHNKGFDENCLKAVFRTYGMDYPDYDFYCTLQTSRRVIKGLPNYQLHTVAARCGYELEQHHHALADAEACAQIALMVFDVR